MRGRRGWKPELPELDGHGGNGGVLGEKAGEQLGQGLGCVSTEVRGGGVEAGSSKVLKQTFAAALPRSRALAGYSAGSSAHPQESAISRLPSGSISWLFTCDQRQYKGGGVNIQNSARMPDGRGGVR